MQHWRYMRFAIVAMAALAVPGWLPAQEPAKKGEPSKVAAPAAKEAQAPAPAGAAAKASPPARGRGGDEEGRAGHGGRQGPRAVGAGRTAGPGRGADVPVVRVPQRPGLWPGRADRAVDGPGDRDRGPALRRLAGRPGDRGR